MIAWLLGKAPFLGKVPWKLVGAGVVVLLLWWQVYAYAERKAERRADARESEIRELWRVDTLKRDKATADAIAIEVARAEAQRLENAKELEDAHKQLAAIAADRDSVDSLLRRARDQVRALAASAATGERGLDALTGIAARAEALDRRLADYDAACQRDAVRFEALQNQLRPQL